MKYKIGNKVYEGDIRLGELVEDLEKNREINEFLDSRKEGESKNQTAEEILEELK